MRDYADDAAAVMDAMGIDKAMILGISFGGMVAQEFAVRHTARLSRLALQVTSPVAQAVLLTCCTIGRADLRAPCSPLKLTTHALMIIGWPSI